MHHASSFMCQSTQEGSIGTTPALKSKELIYETQLVGFYSDFDTRWYFSKRQSDKLMASRQSKNSTKSPDAAALKLVGTLADKPVEIEQRPVFADGDLGKVQEILFGQQLNSSNEQIRAIEKRFDEQLAEANEKWLTLTTELTQQFEHKLATLSNELKQESSHRHEEHTQTIQALQSSHSSLENLITDSDTRASNADTARQYDLQNARAQWSSTLESTKEQLLQKMIDTAEQLDSQKVDRQALSGLLGTIASGLTNIDTTSNDESAEPNDAYSKK